MSRSTVTSLVLVWSGAWALYRIALPFGLFGARSISELRRIFYQVVGTLLVPSIVAVFTYDWGWSFEAMAVSATAALLLCLGLYGIERWNRTRPRKRTVV